MDEAVPAEAANAPAAQASGQPNPAQFPAMGPERPPGRAPRETARYRVAGVMHPFSNDNAKFCCRNIVTSKSKSCLMGGMGVSSNNSSK